MTIAFALMAAGVPSVTTPPTIERVTYVAQQTPAKAIKLEAKTVCKDVSGEPVQYVDPARLALQVVMQLEMYDELQAKTATALLAELNGEACAKATDASLAAAEKTRLANYCTGSIALQRMLMGIYPGYHTTTATADLLKVRSDDFEAALEEDIEQLDDRQKTIIEQLTKSFLTSTPADKRVACTFGQSDEPAVVARYGAGAVLAGGATGLGAFLKTFQFRRHPGNLVYRGDISSLSSAPATWAAGRDLGSTDSGFGISLDRGVGDETSNKGFNRTKTFKVQGAISAPLCGIWGGDGKPCKVPGKKIDFDLAPYWAREYEKVGTTNLVDPTNDKDPEKKSNREEFGGVLYFAMDRDPETECLLASVFSNVKECGHLVTVRYSDLKNKGDSTHLRAWSARYTPVLATNPPGFKFFELCLNKFCGDPDQIVRSGLLFDARYSHGDFVHRGVYDLTTTPLSPQQLMFNDNYDRVGVRVGAMAQVNILPSVPFTVWSAYTHTETLRGYNKNLGLFQLQTSLDLAPATLSLEWRNGRREDTAKRDSSLVLSLGLKTK